MEKNRIVKIIVGTFFTILAIYICFFKLGDSLLENWDEGFYAEVTKQMLKTNDFAVMRWNGDVFVDKPPLNFWLNYFSAKIFGLSEFSIRLVSAIAGLMVILLTTFYAFRHWGMVASLFTFSAIALNNIFIWRTRTGNLDALASLLILLSFLLISSSHKYRYYLLAFVFGLIFLQKASLVAFPIFVFLLYEYFFNRKEIFKNKKRIVYSILIFIFIISLWLVPATLSQGILYLKYYLFKSDQGVSHINLLKIKPDYWLFAYYSLQRRLFYIFIFGLGLLLLNIKKRQEFLIFSFATFLLFLLSLTERNNNWYLVPSIPFWALTIGYVINTLIGFTKQLIKKHPRFYYGFLLCWIFGIAILLAISYKTFSVNIKAIIDTKASVAEVATARFIKKHARAGDKICRLDFAYPVTIYYSDLKTYNLDYVDHSLLEMIDKNDIKWVAGKSNKVEEFIRKSKYSYDRYEIEEEVVLHLK